MDYAALDAVVDESKAFLADLFMSTSFAETDEMFGSIDEPVLLNDVRYKVRFFRALTRHPLAEGGEVHYTFFLLNALDGVKERFLAEVEKEASGGPADNDVIGKYYAPFVPGFVEFDELRQDLTLLLGERIFANRPYRFEYLFGTVTADFEVALIFVEIGSLMRASGSSQRSNAIMPSNENRSS
jgi:hypothetical protein